MDFEYSEKVQDLLHRVRKFIDTEIMPNEATYNEQLATRLGDLLEQTTQYLKATTLADAVKSMGAVCPNAER